MRKRHGALGRGFIADATVWSFRASPTLHEKRGIRKWLVRRTAKTKRRLAARLLVFWGSIIIKSVGRGRRNFHPHEFSVGPGANELRRAQWKTEDPDRWNDGDRFLQDRQNRGRGFPGAPAFAIISRKKRGDRCFDLIGSTGARFPSFESPSATHCFLAANARTSASFPPRRS